MSSTCGSAASAGDAQARAARASRRIRKGRLRWLREVESLARRARRARRRIGGGTFGGRGRELARERELGPHRPVAGVEAERFLVGARGEAGVDVAEILVRDGVLRVGADRALERVARPVVLPARGVDDGDVVVRLGELGVILGEREEEIEGLVRAALLGEDHALQEPAALVGRLGGEVAVDRRGGSGEIAPAGTPRARSRDRRLERAARTAFRSRRGVRGWALMRIVGYTRTGVLMRRDSNKKAVPAEPHARRLSRSRAQSRPRRCSRSTTR